MPIVNSKPRPCITAAQKKQGLLAAVKIRFGRILCANPQCLEKLGTATFDNTKIIPGHVPLADRAQLQKYRQMLATAYERLRKLKAEGKAAAEAAAAKPLADLEEAWGKGMFKGDRWIEIIYSGV